MQSPDCRSALVLPASVDRCWHVIRPLGFQDGEYRLADAVKDEKGEILHSQAVSIRDDGHSLVIPSTQRLPSIALMNIRLAADGDFLCSRLSK